MKNIWTYLLPFLSIFIVSCGGVSQAEYDALLSENDSLRNAKAQIEREFNAYQNTKDTAGNNEETSLKDTEGNISATEGKDNALISNDASTGSTPLPTSSSEDTDNGMFYRILLFTLKMDKPVESFGIPDLKVSEKNGLYKYYLGDFNTKTEADKVLKKYKTQYPEAILLTSKKN